MTASRTSGSPSPCTLHPNPNPNPDPEPNPNQWLTFFLHDDAKLQHIHDEYASGRMLSGEIKNQPNPNPNPNP